MHVRGGLYCAGVLACRRCHSGDSVHYSLVVRDGTKLVGKGKPVCGHNTFCCINIRLEIRFCAYHIGHGIGQYAQQDAAAWFIDSIDRSLQWVGSRGKFYTDAQRREVLDLFLQGRDAYVKMLR